MLRTIFYLRSKRFHFFFFFRFAMCCFCFDCFGRFSATLFRFERKRLGACCAVILKSTLSHTQNTHTHSYTACILCSISCETKHHHRTIFGKMLVLCCYYYCYGCLGVFGAQIDDRQNAQMLQNKHQDWQILDDSFSNAWALIMRIICIS